MSLPLSKESVSISTGTIIRFFIVILTILALFYLRDIVLVVIAAVVIASAIEPVVRRIRHYLKFNRITSVVIVYVLIVSILAMLLVFFVPAVMNETVRFVDSIPRTVSLSDLWSPIENSGLFTNTDGVANGKIVLLKDFIIGLQSLLIGSGEGAFHMASVIFGGVFSLIMIFVLSFYLAIREDGVDDFLQIIAPIRHHDYIINLWKRSRRKIGLWLQGQIILGLIVGVLVYISLISVGIPYALPLAVLAALLEIVPVFGPILASIPAILLTFADRGLSTTILIAVLYFIIQQLENHIIVPLVTKKIIGVNPIIVILALLIGFKLAGVLGALVAVPLSAALMEYVSDIEKKRTK